MPYCVPILRACSLISLEWAFPVPLSRYLERARFFIAVVKVLLDYRRQEERNVTGSRDQ